MESQICITLPDGNKKFTKYGTTIQEFLSNLSISLSKSALAAVVNEKEVDLSYTLTEDCTLKILTYETKEGKEVFRHSSAHLLGQAIQRLYPKALLTIGPVVENGPGFFYYDVDFGDVVVTTDDLPTI
ncbi:MAG: TGS domain-containing protein [Leptospiraceae bacterium]|nr:TGS domain-containing protein [Leptospiraceae bacterium]